MNRHVFSPISRRRPGLLLVVLLAGASAAAAAQPATEAPPAELFPQPLRVEHQLVEREGDGTAFYGETLRDTFGGSWIVSERPDRSRLVIDLARREITEIRPTEGVYWTIGFARLAELRRRIAEIEPGGRGEPSVAVEAALPAAGRSAVAPPELELIELNGVAARSLGGGPEPAAESLPAAMKAAGIRKLTVRARGAAEPAAEVWVDPRFRLTAAAQAAIGAFEEDALGRPPAAGGDPATAPIAPARVMAEVRRGAGGALPVFTALPIYGSRGEKVGESEDRVLTAERLEAFPAELARVPEGLVRASHPLESILAALETQARIDAQLAGKPSP